MIFALRCDRCHHFLEDATEPMMLMGTFRASAPAQFPKMDPEERRARCRSCGFVNVFHPLRETPPESRL